MQVHIPSDKCIFPHHRHTLSQVPDKNIFTNCSDFLIFTSNTKIMKWSQALTLVSNNDNENIDHPCRRFNKGWVPGTLTCLRWSLVPPDFKECCIRYSLHENCSNFNK